MTTERRSTRDGHARRWLAGLDGGRGDVIFDAAAGGPGRDILAAFRLDLDGDVGEAGGRQPALDGVPGRGAGDTAAEQRLVGGEFRRQRPDVHHVGDGEASARFQHAESLAEHLRLVGHQVDHAVGDDHVAGGIRDRQVLEFAQAELDIGRAYACGVVSGLGQHLVGHVDADHAALRPDLPGGEQAVEAGAAAEIDQHLAGAQGRDRLGIAAAEAEIGAVRHGTAAPPRCSPCARPSRPRGCSRTVAGAQQDALAAAMEP